MSNPAVWLWIAVLAWFVHAVHFVANADDGPTTVWSSDGSISYRYTLPEGVEYEIDSASGESKINWTTEEETSDSWADQDEKDLDN